MHAVVRFRLVEQSGETSLNLLLINILQRGLPTLPLELLKRIPRIIALASTAGISSLEFSEVLKFLRTPTVLTISLLQALNEMITPTSQVFHRPPSAFFVFNGPGSGLYSSKVPLSIFSKDLQLCLWFRIEDVPEGQSGQGGGSEPSRASRHCLFRLADIADNGVGIFVTGKDLLVTFTNSSGKTEEFTVRDYNIAPGHWCHLSACFIKPKYMLYSVDELRIYIDSQCLLQQKVNFYRWTKDSKIDDSLSLRIGPDLIGEMGPVFLFSEILSPAFADIVASFNTGNLIGARGPGSLNIDLEADIISLSAENSRGLPIGMKSVVTIPNPLVVYSPLR